MQFLSNNLEKIECEKDLLKTFFDGFKEQENIGVECEKLVIQKQSFDVATYFQIAQILSEFDSNNYSPIFENENIVGLKHKNGNISLEPGSQVEFSTIPFGSLIEIKNALFEYLKDLKSLLFKQNLEVLDIGALPKTIWNDIQIIPKSRYKHMTKYLPTKGLEPFRMMRETAGIQVNLDYKDEEDAIEKLALSLKLSPIVSAMYANSPYRNGKLSGLKSTRAYAWLNVDEERCGFVSEKLLEKNVNFSFKDYKDILLKIPMIFIARNDETVYCELTFEEFLKNGYQNYQATIDDWNNHLSLFFPEARLKNHLEIRNHDNQNDEMTMTVPALWKGILYNKDALNEVKSILKRFDVQDFIELRHKTPVYALDYKLKGLWVKDIAQELVAISKYSLSKDEKEFLEPLEELISQGITPADILLKNELTKV